MIPARDWYRFDTDPGTEHVYLVLSTAPIEALDHAAASGGVISSRLLEKYVNGSAAKSIEVSDGDDEDVPGIQKRGPDMIVRHLRLKHLPS